MRKIFSIIILTIILSSCLPLPAATVADVVVGTPTLWDTILNNLSWIIPGIIILLRLIPTRRNVDIIAFLTWILDSLIPNLKRNTSNDLVTHPTKERKTIVGRIIQKIINSNGIR